jgi:hypothetical protein
MGQYWTLFNLTKKQFVSMIFPAKLTEMVCDTKLSLIMTYLLADRECNGKGGGDFDSEAVGELFGTWCGDKIALKGDYCEDNHDSDTFHDITIQVGEELSELDDHHKIKSGIHKRVETAKQIYGAERATKRTKPNTDAKPFKAKRSKSSKSHKSPRRVKRKSKSTKSAKSTKSTRSKKTRTTPKRRAAR